MAKIRDLNDAQLFQNIEKYQKILSGLHKERVRRIEADPSLKETLFTKEEILQEKKAVPAPAEAAAPAPKKQSEGTPKKTLASIDGDNSFQINFEDSELEKINTATAREQEEEEEQNEEDAVRMTEVLKLTNEQLNEFNKSKKEKKS